MTKSPAVIPFRIQEIDRIIKMLFGHKIISSQLFFRSDIGYLSSLRKINIQKRMQRTNVRTLQRHKQPQASTSVWNNSRDVLVEFVWKHMLACDTEHLEKYSITNQGQQKQFSSSTVSKYARYESSSGKTLLTFPLVSTPCLYWDAGKTEEKT